MSLELRPCDFQTAAQFVGAHHRHNKPPIGHKFSIACYDGDRLCGVCMVGRPIGRYLDDGLTLEVNRCCTDGTKNADCPLVHVPPHGALIDRDALIKILSKVIDINASIEQRNEATDQERRCLWWFEQQIGIAPTIIPADPAEEGE